MASDPAAFLVVHDVAASWATYPSCGLALGDGPIAGLILHAAGPTDDGFRTIDVWESEEALRRHEHARGNLWPGGLVVPPVVRSLHVLHLIGERRGSAGG